MDEPDYEKLTQEQLKDVLDHIDQERFKDRYIRAKSIFESRGGIESLNAVQRNSEKWEWFFPMLIFGIAIYLVLNLIIPENYFSSHHYRHYLIRGVTLISMVFLLIVFNRDKGNEKEN